MQTPNWGPRAGEPMDQATFDAYVVAYPPGQPTGGLYGNPQVGANAQRDPYSTPNGAFDPLHPQSTPGADGANWWEKFFANGPAQVQMPTFQTGNQDQSRLQQQQVIQDLQRLALGDRNSAAQQQLSNAYGAARSQQSSLGSTMRGQSAGAAMRGIQAGQQGISRTQAGDSQMLQLQEQQAAQAMLAQLLTQQHGQDITQATGMASGVNQGNAMNEAMRQFYTQGQLEAGLGREGRARDLRLSQLGVNQGYGDLAQAGVNSLVNAGAGLAGSYFSAGGKQQSPQHDDPYGGDHG